MKHGWEVKKLKEVCEKITDGTHQTPKYFDEGIVFLSSKNVTSGKIDWENIKYIDEKQHLEMHKRVAPRVGDILLAKNGTTGVAAMVDRDLVCDIYVSLAHIRVLDEVSPEFMLYFINSPFAKKQFNKRLKGIGVPNLHLEEIREVLIPFPKLKIEQQRIVAILDEVFDGIAKAKANAEQNLKNAQELFESYLQSVFETKGEGWEEKALGEVCATGAGGTPLKSHKDYYENGIIPWLRSGEVDKKDIFECELYISEKGLKNSSAKLFPKNTVLIAMYGATAGQVGILRFECSTNQAVCGILPNDNFIPEFLYYKFLSGKQELVAQAVGGAQPNISQIKIKNTLVPILTCKDQQTIVQKLDALSLETKKLETIYRTKIADLEELKKSILHKAFNGELK